MYIRTPVSLKCLCISYIIPNLLYSHTYHVRIQLQVMLKFYSVSNFHNTIAQMSKNRFTGIPYKKRKKSLEQLRLALCDLLTERRTDNNQMLIMCHFAWYFQQQWLQIIVGTGRLCAATMMLSYETNIKMRSVALSQNTS